MLRHINPEQSPSLLDPSDLTPAKQRRIKVLRVSGDFLDRLNGQEPVVFEGKGLPSDAQVCGLTFCHFSCTYRLLIASASCEVVSEYAFPPELPDLWLRTMPDAAPLPFLEQETAAFLKRARATLTDGAELEDAVILPRFYTEGFKQ